jgi:ribose transport system ATP-binding protein
MSSSPDLLVMSDIDKAFGGVPALRKARLSLAAGEIHALIGQNGAGKSTLIKILSGAYARDDGHIAFEGGPVNFKSPVDAQNAGISTIYQELNLIPLRSAAENIFIGREPCRAGFIDWRRVERESARILAGFGVDVDVRRPLGSFNTATQQMIAIARAVSTRARLVIMDEPTSSLDDTEVATLFRVIRQLKADGVAVIFVSHRLDELYAVCDRITVMRDGQTVAERDMRSFDKLQLVSTMLGKSLSTAADAPRRPASPAADKVLELHQVRSGLRVHDASLSIAKGEILGLAGLLGSGRTELARAVFGADPADGGEIRIDGRLVDLRQPADAIARGVAFLSEDRKVEGIVPDLSIRENLTLVLLPQLTRWGVVDRKRQLALTETFIARLGIRCAGPEQPIRELSGGNQQKVLLARWLASRISVLLLDEPTRGIDVGAKAEILSLIRELADQDGLAVLMIASELDELVQGSDRIMVLRDGRTVEELQGGRLSQDQVMAAMANGSQKPRGQAEPAPSQGGRHG